MYSNISVYYLLMPAGIKEAFKSPFHKSNPSSQLYDLNSFTKSSCTDSIRNEYYQANNPNLVSDFNNNYHLNERLPDYKPFERYPTLHPLNDEQDENSIIKDPHQGAGWIQRRDCDPCPTHSPRQDFQDFHEDQEEQMRPRNEPSEKTICDDLINKVLSNKYCRRMLRKILMEEDEIVQPSRGTLFESDMIRNIIIYCLGGLLLLFIVELLFKLGQLMK